MTFRTRTYVCLLLLAVLALGAGAPVFAQNSDHAVSPQDLRKDVQKASNDRHRNEGAIRDLLSTEQAQKAVKAANADMRKVNDAVSQLSDEDAARLAAQSREVQKDIAAGNFSDRDLLIIVVVIAVLVLIIVAVR
jgi:uncharacterized protein HemX